MQLQTETEYNGAREAFVEVNDRHIAVRLRTEDQNITTCEADIVVALSGNTYHSKLARKPRLSTDNHFWGAYFELEAFRDGNLVADSVKASLTAMEYVLMKERFDV
jgi:hypothetical protein